MVKGNRDKSIEIHFINGSIPKGIKDKYDIEYSSKEDSEILWIHPDGYKAFERELFQYLATVTKVVNRKALHLGKEKTDYLDLFIESEVIDEMGLEIEGKKYKNVRWSEVGETDLDKVKLKRELN
jgi:hypothetical protein